MLRKGDICTYIPSGRKVVVHHDQNSGKVISVIEHDVGNPDRFKSILGVPPSDLRRIDKEHLGF